MAPSSFVCYTLPISQTLTCAVCIKLDVGDHAPVLSATQAAFNEATTWIARVCRDEGIINTNTAHHRVYGETRPCFGLGAQLACCARAKAVEAIKATKAKGQDTCPIFGPRGSVRYDARTSSLMALDRVSLNTLTGRVVCRLLPGHRQHTLLVDPRNTSRTCSVCGHCEQASRHSQASFRCRRCDLSMTADHNAAINIAYRTAANQPIVCSA